MDDNLPVRLLEYFLWIALEINFRTAVYRRFYG